MAQTDLFSVDLNQLNTLRMVFRLNSFSDAAEALGVTQSTVSYSVNRLRKAFNDPLFVRQGGGIAATERCRAIVDAAVQVLDGFEALSRPVAFDPAATDQSVTISCNAYERIVLIPPLIRRLRQDAPGLRLNIISAFASGSRHLLDGDADLVVSPVEVADSGIYAERLISERYVCVMDPANPLAARGMDAAAYLAASHVVVTYGGAWRSPYRAEIESLGHRLNQVVGTPSPADLPTMLQGTDMIATAPLRVARSFGSAVRIVNCPFPAPFEIQVYWAARSNTSPLIRWLRAALQDVARQVDGPGAP